MAYMLGRLTSAILIGSVTLGLFQPVYADSTQVGRYLTVSNKPKLAQVDLLSQEFQVRFPVSVQTIGEAMDYLLKQSGYRLIPETKQSAELKLTLSKPLPAIDRDFGPMQLKNGLSTLVGPVFILVSDPLNRWVNFSVRPSFSAVSKQSISK